MFNNAVQKTGTLQSRIVKELRRNWILYLMILPVLAYFITFKYVPMYGVQIAFRDYRIKKGIIGSEWVGLEHFQRFFRSYNFKALLKNTLTLSLYSLLVGFPVPILFALMLNYLRSTRLKKTVQMVSYAPHFISTVVICSMLQIFCDRDTGVFNALLGLFGKEPVSFLADAKLFKHIYVWSGVWQNMGWNAIIYISALAGVDYEMHEAAIIDGASKLQRMRYIDLPSIKSTIVMLLILRFGSIMDVGFEKVYLLQNSLNRSVASIISTYVYEMGLVDHDYSYSAAVGLFNTVINVILLVGANTLSKKMADESLY